AQSDPLPNFINFVHVKTQDYVVRQELLVSPGQIWDQEKIDEGQRNLRKLFILAVARALACKSEDPDKVILLVVTKDLWSIRTNITFNQTGKVMKLLEFVPTEENFLGRNKRVSLHVRLSQLDFSGPVVRDHIALGQMYKDQRLFGTHLQVFEQFDAIIDGRSLCGGAIGDQTRIWCPPRARAPLAGALGHIVFGRPLFSVNTKWGFRIQAYADAAQQRHYRQNTDLGNIPQGESPGLSLRTLLYDGHPDGRPRAVPFVYDRLRLLTSGGITRSFGHEIKHNITSGIAAYRLHFTPPDNFPFDQTTTNWYVREFLPRSETAAFLFVNYSSYTNRFVRLQNIQTFALSEDYWLGHNVSLEARFANNLERSTQSFIELEAIIAYRWYFSDNLLWASLIGGSRWQPNLDELDPSSKDIPWISNQLQIGIKNISPRLGIGRFHAQILAVLRHNDPRRWMDFSFLRHNDPRRSADVATLHTAAQDWPLVAPFGLHSDLISLGGDSGLRGYPADHFQGANLFRVNVEYRRDPVNLFTLHCGFVIFYDGGSVFGQGLPFDYRHSVGVGLRGHFPQFDKETLSIDFGVPLRDDRGSWGTWFSFSFNQVF
ncbi:MAG: hypothetical protein V1754_02380, partial [Pseudomonadota bacterium]